MEKRKYGGCCTAGSGWFRGDTSRSGRAKPGNTNLPQPPRSLPSSVTPVQNASGIG
jgi:hypothetical protein